jgi:hypothetical protein
VVTITDTLVIDLQGVGDGGRKQLSEGVRCPEFKEGTGVIYSLGKNARIRERTHMSETKEEAECM